jgi:Raf kinase inhibitor-like YbhB/YbcL family protein
MEKHVALMAMAIMLMNGQCRAFEISSPAVGADGTIPLKYTANHSGCEGENISLPLVWKDVPTDTKSLAVTMFDPDAGAGRGFWHWLVVDLPATTRAILEGAGQPNSIGLPRGAVQVRNDAGVSGYFGPCPPRGDHPHRYVITLFALKSGESNVDPAASATTVAARLQSDEIASASVTYRYGR